MRDKRVVSANNTDEQLRAVLATVNDWHEAFSKSPAFARLSASHQRKSGAITEFFAKHTYEYLDLSPNEWDSDAVEECCTEILPRKVSAEVSFFEAIAPVLSAFFNFLEDQSLLRNGRALAEVVEDLEDEIVTNAEDRSNWGPAKHFVMAARNAGVDIQDPDAMRAFMLQISLQQFARSDFAGARRSSGPDPYASGPEQAKFSPPADRCDPCPCGSGKKYKFCCEQKR
jgi:uncharacterized protein YecA (UPF0149 family)